MARLEAVYGARMCEIYGLTETGGNTSICWPHDPVDMRHDSDGRPNTGVEVKMIDPATGARQPDGTPGELCVRGWNVMLGYFRDPEATSRTIDADGWLHTGDMGVQLPDGFIRWLSRLKDMIRVGFVFQRPVLLPWRRVIDNVLLPVEVMGLGPRSTYEARAHELLGMVGLAGFEHAYPGELSGGMQQRVAIVRSLVYDNTVLLMDEPFAALDAMAREELNLELLRIWQMTGRSIVFVPHNIPEAVLLSDRIAVMTPRPGQVRQVVPVDLPRPRSLSLMGDPRSGALTDGIRACSGGPGAAHAG
jgi:ABC-type nitrate/sulfonate/bicarbonate transport system ATPase subunit